MPFRRLTPEEKEMERQANEKMLEVLRKESWLFRLPPYPPGTYGIVLRIIYWSLAIFGLGAWIYLGRAWKW